MTRRAHAVVGTAGHVDHGKTSLVRALTGVDCDRLPEEKRRGITIDLGFARWEPQGFSASIVDVPGHERFVQTMVAGAAGIDLVLLVVAADDGVMPQTREHLAICEELGIGAGIVVVTKCDLVDDEMLELVADDIRSTTRGTFLEAADVVPCSVRDGRGLDDVAHAAGRALDVLRPVPASGPPWLSVDRVFTKHGFGTIATGTLVRGAVAVGDTLEAMPIEGGVEPVLVRGLSVHDCSVDRATATTRLALNLRSADRGRLARGVVLAAPGTQRPTRVVDVDLRLFADAPPLDARTEMVLHVGAAHATVRARALEPARIEPGERGVVRLSATSAFATYAGQRFVLRRPELGARRTVAGGVIIDPHPAPARRRKGDAAPSATSDPSERARAIVEASAGATLAGLRERLAPGTAVEAVAAGLVAGGAVVEAHAGGERRLFSRPQLERAKSAALIGLAGFHREHPALSGATTLELEGRLPARLRPLAARAVADLVREGKVRGSDRVCLPAHDAHATRERVAELYRSSGLGVGSDDAVCELAGLPERTFREVVGELARERRLTRLAAGLHVHDSVLDDLRARVGAWFDAHETLAPGDFKSLTGLTRKNAIVLLEWLDKKGVTRRRGDVRVRA